MARLRARWFRAVRLAHRCRLGTSKAALAIAAVLFSQVTVLTGGIVWCVPSAGNAVPSAGVRLNASEPNSRGGQIGSHGTES